MPDRVEMLDIKGLLGLEMAGHLFVFDPKLYDWLKEKNLPGVTLDIDTLGGSICQVRLDHNAVEGIYAEYLKFRKEQENAE